MRIVCIGCAPTTLGFAYRLNEIIKEGIEDVDDIELIVLEKEMKPGGLSGTIRDEHGFLWDMGGHITFSHNFPYYEKATKEAIKEWNNLERNCMVDLNYLYGESGINLVPYPAQFAVPLFPEETKRKCLTELKQRYEDQQNISQSSPTDFESWVLHHFGPSILEIFFKPYTKKVWTVDTSKMSCSWVGTRVAKLPQEKLEELCEMGKEELKKADFGWGPNTHFTFPKYGGTGAVWEKMEQMLPSKWFKYGTKVIKIDYNKKRLVYTNTEGREHRLSYDILINSGPIDLLVEQTKICTPLQLKHNKVIIVGVGLELPFTEFCQKFTWLYFPDPKVPFYRVTFFSRYGDVTPDSSKYWSVMCDCALPCDDPATEEEIRDQAVEGLIRKTIIKREKIVSIFSITLPYGYPIPTIQRDSELSRCHSILEEYQIYSRGRFGGWKYEVSNQDHCFIQGKELCDRLVLGENEKLYKTLVPEKRG
uniref:Amine oxidase domain-containing protein n=1 Tax=Meloidogyne incognita TaxID=6306 RepID=A0A914M3Z2_MELIC